MVFFGDADSGQNARGGNDEHDGEKRRERRPRAHPQSPFRGGDGRDEAQTTALPAKAACTASVSIRPSGGRSKPPTNSPLRRSPMRSATWQAP